MDRAILNNNDELCNILVLHTGGTIGMSKNENEGEEKFFKSV